MTHAEPTCRDVADLLTDHLEETLSPDLCAAIERHLATCLACGTSHDQMRITVELLERLCRAYDTR